MLDTAQKITALLQAEGAVLFLLVAIILTLGAGGLYLVRENQRTTAEFVAFLRAQEASAAAQNQLIEQRFREQTAQFFGLVQTLVGKLNKGSAASVGKGRRNA